MKLSCNHELLGDLHSSGSMKSARLQLFFGLGFTSISLCCHKNKQQKRLKKNMKKFCIFKKPRCNKLITMIGCVSE